MTTRLFLRYIKTQNTSKHLIVAAEIYKSFHCSLEYFDRNRQLQGVRYFYPVTATDLSDFSPSILCFANNFAKIEKSVIIRVNEAKYSHSLSYSMKMCYEK